MTLRESGLSEMAQGKTENLELDSLEIKCREAAKKLSLLLEAERLVRFEDEVEELD
jgi:hypothetical protein